MTTRTIKVPNDAQKADSILLVERLTPLPPEEVAAEMDAIHVARGTGAHCGCGACIAAFGNDLQVEEPD